VTPEGAEQSILCIDEECVISADNPSPGEAFFGADGKASPAIQQALDFLTALEHNREVTNLAVSSLAQAGVIKPWPITIKSEQGDRTVSGIYCIDEAALNALPDEDFIKLRATGALPIAYAQLLFDGTARGVYASRSNTGAVGSQAGSSLAGHARQAVRPNGQPRTSI
jgi:hypothetical protein